MSAVCGGNESVQKIILPESSRSCISSSNTLSNLSARVVDEVVQPSDTPAANRHTEANGTYFDLLENEEEERLLSDLSPLHVVDNTRRVAAAGSPKSSKLSARHAATVPSLRSVSVPKGGATGYTSKNIANSSSAVHVNMPKSESSPSRVPLSSNEVKKPKKEVSEYYKKQNELLENFKQDSEQIQVFQRARTRQRLQSSTSTEAEGVKEEVRLVNHNELRKESRGTTKTYPAEDPMAPLLKDNDGEVSVNLGDTWQHNDRPSSSNVRIQERKPSSASDISMLAKREAALDAMKATSKAATRLAYTTLLVNVSLMIAKAVASYLSGSMSILSSLVDSCVDITSGLVISISTRMIKKRDPYLYPRGRTRLEPLSLIIISVVMGVASVQLIFSAINRIATAYKYHVHVCAGVREEPVLDVSLVTVSIMVVTVAVKFFLFCICQKYKTDPSIKVLAMDHRNDCLSNTVALACAWLGKLYWYYLDPIGGILVSLYILYTWVNTGWEHLSKLSGKSAKPEFVNRIIKVCIDHDPRISHLDTVYVYHFGTKFLVEVHIVLDKDMPLKVAHDISETLQINIESLPEVERAFVHTDYEYEHQPQDEHKIV